MQLTPPSSKTVTPMLLKRLLLLSTLFIATATQADFKLNEKCVVNILNRTIQVSKEGGWALPNVPTNMGRVRARATCSLDDGTTRSGQSDYFTLTNNAITEVPDIQFEQVAEIPTELNFEKKDGVNFTRLTGSAQMRVFAKYKDGSIKDVTSAAQGVNFTTTNAAIATVTNSGLIVSSSNGAVLINPS